MEGPGSSGWRIHLIEDRAVLEVGFVRLRPAAKNFLDREQIDVRELTRELGRDRGIARSIKVLGGDALALGAVQVFEIRLRDRARAMLVDDTVDQRDGRFGKDAERGIDDLELVTTGLAEGQVGLVFPGDQD